MGAHAREMDAVAAVGIAAHMRKKAHAKAMGAKISTSRRTLFYVETIQRWGL